MIEKIYVYRGGGMSSQEVIAKLKPSPGFELCPQPALPTLQDIDNMDDLKRLLDDKDSNSPTNPVMRAAAVELLRSVFPASPI